MEKNRKGDHAELKAVAWLWEQGYEVFRNCGCTGPIDLVAITPEGDTILIDVKNMLAQPHLEDDPNKRRRSGSNITDAQKELGVQVLGYNLELDKFYFIRHPYETTYSRYRDGQQPQLDLVCGDAG